jgi:hypothetical protein
MDNEIKEYNLKQAEETLKHYGVQIIRTEPVQKQGEYREDYK